MAGDKLEIDGIKIRITSNIDKADGFIYHTCWLEDGSFITFSKFDGNDLLIANASKDTDTNLVKKLLEVLSH